MESEILFLGGCADGQRRVVDGRDVVVMPQFNKDGTITNIYYRRERIVCEGVPFAVMVERSRSRVWAMQTLLEGYKSNTRPSNILGKGVRSCAWRDHISPCENPATSVRVVRTDNAK